MTNLVSLNLKCITFIPRLALINSNRQTNQLLTYWIMLGNLLYDYWNQGCWGSLWILYADSSRHSTQTIYRFIINYLVCYLTSEMITYISLSILSVNRFKTSLELNHSPIMRSSFTKTPMKVYYFNQI